MISVLSHRQPLSGNRLRIYILSCFLTLLLACSSSKNISNVPDRDRGRTSEIEPRQKGEKVDTVKWTEVPEEKATPILDKDEPVVEKKRSYTMAIALPFQSEGNVDPYNERFIQFYAGIQMALDALRNESINISLKSYDTEGNAQVLNSKLNGLAGEAQLVIGPYQRECLQVAAQWAKDNKVPVVSPWISSNRITKENPYYIQLRPSVRDHYITMVNSILDNYNPEQVVVLKQSNGEDDKKVRFIQDYAAALLNQEGSLPFREVSVIMDSLILGETYLSDLFDDEKETVFISQNYLFDEDEFVYNCLRKLSAAKGDRKTTVYAMPLVMDLDEIGYNIYRLLNLHVVRARYVDPYDPGVKTFRDDFFYRFNTLPIDEAYYGYDIGLYFGKMLDKYGLSFQFNLDQEEDIELLEVSFDIQKEFIDNRFSDDYRDINFFSNKHLDIVRFNEDRFVVEDKD